MGKKILIIDDDPDVCQAMRVRLKANGYETYMACDALSSVSEARDHQPDLIILDLGLPGGDGFVVMDRLKRDPAVATIPVIVVSAHDSNMKKERAIEAGAQFYLQKPVSNTELLAIVRLAINEPEVRRGAI